jgi:hypothetical protein
MTDDALVRAFERGDAPEAGFHHADHVRVAWYYVRQATLPEALLRFSTGLRRFAVAQGKPDLYHETITVAYVLLIAERVSAMPDAPWEEFAERNGDVLAWKPSILSRFYSDERLWSERARRVFLMPDLARSDP